MRTRVAIGVIIAAGMAGLVGFIRPTTALIACNDWSWWMNIGCW